jgi:transcriptional regulator with XRE-family HTH domain
MATSSGDGALVVNALGTRERAGGLAALLRAHRKRIGVSQKDLADLSTVSVRTIRYLESGRANHPRRETLRLIADALRIGESQRAALETVAGGATSGSDTRPTHDADVPLPVRFNTLLGRDAELQTVQELVASAAERMITVVGIGGVGKSRLVLECAHELQANRGFSVFWVPSVDGDPGQPDEFPSVVTRTLAVLRSSVQALAKNEDVNVRLLGRLIGSGNAALVLDGYDDTKPSSDALLRLMHHCPRLRIVVTTTVPRNGLGMILPLAPLPVPVENRNDDPADVERVESVRLLLRHVGLARPDLGSNPCVATLAGICRAVDGVPAALQSIGQWSHVYTLHHLLRLLSADPLAFASWGSGPYDTHRTAASVRRSLDALDASPRQLLASLMKIGRPWSVGEAADQAGGSGHHVANDVHLLLLNGLVRRVGEPGDAHFQVLNIVRFLWDQ